MPCNIKAKVSGCCCTSSLYLHFVFARSEFTLPLHLVYHTKLSVPLPTVKYQTNLFSHCSTLEIEAEMLQTLRSWQFWITVQLQMRILRLRALYLRSSSVQASAELLLRVLISEACRCHKQAFQSMLNTDLICTLKCEHVCISHYFCDSCV